MNIDKEPDASGAIKNFIVGHCREDGLGLSEWWRTNTIANPN